MNSASSCTTFNVTAVGASYPAPISIPATAGESYQITVQGTYFANDGIYADAKYSSRYVPVRRTTC